MILLILLAIIAGVATFLMTTINSGLRGYVESPYVSSLISFVVGTVLLAVLQTISGGALIPTGEQIACTPWWTYLGGFLGMAVMTSYILLFPIIGGVQTVAMPILGQIIMSMVIDNFGLFGASRKPLGILNILGILILIAGVIILIILPDYLQNRKKTAVINHKKTVWGWQLIGVFAGMLLGIQIAVNGSLGVRLQSPLQAAFISFIIGTAILFFIVAATRSFRNIGNIAKRHAPWWVLIGGVFGSAYIYLSAYLAPQIGTGTVVVLALVGQMSASLCVDHFGLLGATQRKVSGIQIIGLIIMLIGVGIIKLF